MHDRSATSAWRQLTFINERRNTKGERVVRFTPDRRGEGTENPMQSAKTSKKKTKKTRFTVRKHTFSGTLLHLELHLVTWEAFEKLFFFFTFNLSFIFGNYLLVLSEFRRRRHGWVWRSNHLPSSRSQFGLDQSIKSAVDWGDATLQRGLKKRGKRRDGILGAPQCARGSVLSPCLRSLRAHCEFGAAAAAAAVCSHPPPRLTASSKPVMVQTTSSERRCIPLSKHKQQPLVSQHFPKVFVFL